MLHDLDETIKRLLATQGGTMLSGVEIDFNIPDRQWSSSILRPTLNVYLFDIHERRALREDGWQVLRNGKEDQRPRRQRPAMFYEITYLITAWTQRNDTQYEDEHRLLWQTLTVLAAYPVLNVKNAQGHIPPFVHGGLQSYPWQIPSAVAQLEGVLKSPGEFWTALENQLKPSLSYVVTLAIERGEVPAGPPVRGTGISLKIPEAPADPTPNIDDFIDLPPGVSPQGIVVSSNDPERGINFTTTVAADGSFSFSGLPPGAHVIEFDVDGATHRRIVTLHGFRVNRIFTLPPNTPLGGIDVTVSGTSYHTTTDAEGQFRLDGFGPGRYTVQITLGGWHSERTVILTDPSARGSSRYEDVVRDQYGTPIPGVVVEVEGTNLREVTDDQGRFGFDLIPGVYTLIFQMQGYTERRSITVRNSGYTRQLRFGGKVQ